MISTLLFLATVFILLTVMMVPHLIEAPTIICVGDNYIYYPILFSSCECAPGFRKRIVPALSNWVTEFGLLCETNNPLIFLYYMILGGCFLGAVIVAPLSDNLGRATIHKWSGVFASCFPLLLLLAFNQTLCAVFLVIIGVSVGTFYCLSTVYISEVVTQEHAALYLLVYNLSFSVAGALAFAML